MVRAYPVILTQVEVPDLEVLTQGKDLENAIEMARDAIGLVITEMQDKEQNIPEPSSEANINIKTSTFAEEGESKLTLVDIDVDAYRRKYCQSMLYKG